MKFNIFQKFVLILLLFLLIISCLLFIPFKEYYTSEIVYRSITFDGGKIDFIRFIIDTLLLILICVFLLIITSSLNNINWQSPATKKFIKRELKFLGLYLLIVAILCSIFYLLNLNQKRKIQQVKHSIALVDSSIGVMSDKVHLAIQTKNAFAADLINIVKNSKGNDWVNANLLGKDTASASKNVFTTLRAKHVLYKYLVSDNYYRKSYEAFVEQFSTSEKVAKLYGFLCAKGKYSKELLDFEKHFFPDVPILNPTTLNSSFENIVNISKDSSKMSLLSNVIQNSAFKTAENDSSLKRDVLGLELALDKIYNKKLSIYKNLFHNPVLFKNRINSINTDIGDKEGQLKIMNNRVSQYQTNLSSIWTCDLTKTYLLIGSILFALLFIFRYFLYLTTSTINYLK